RADRTRCTGSHPKRNASSSKTSTRSRSAGRPSGLRPSHLEPAMTGAGLQTREQAPSARTWFALGVVCLSVLVIVLDNTIMNVAIPSIQESLHANSSQLQWTIDAYTLVFAALLLSAGTIGDRFGRRGTLMVGLAIFGTGSLLAAFSTSAWEL